MRLSRSWIWRAKQVASIPEAEFEAMVESDKPATAERLVAYARGAGERTPSFTSPPDLLAALDLAVAAEAEPRPSRSEMLRRLISDALRNRCRGRGEAE
jgi:hypothetical protein